MELLHSHCIQPERMPKAGAVFYMYTYTDNRSTCTSEHLCCVGKCPRICIAMCWCTQDLLINAWILCIYTVQWIHSQSSNAHSHTTDDDNSFIDFLNSTRAANRPKSFRQILDTAVVLYKYKEDYRITLTQCFLPTFQCKCLWFISVGGSSQ